jgi:hypothetical protein
MIPDAGHYPQSQATDETSKAIVQFLQTNADDVLKPAA